MNLHMVDLHGQYQKIKREIDSAILSVVQSTRFIKGPVVKEFEDNLANYLNVKHVISCANGTDALQVAMMALDLKPGDEVLVPAFTYVATAEVIALLGLIPVMVDVRHDDFNIAIDGLEEKITKKTKAIVPVHLFGQNSNMEAIMTLARKHSLYVIEDAAQSIGSEYTFSNGNISKSGTIGDIGTTSFFPSKNLGCMGDGGALFTNNDDLAKKVRIVANHGQTKQYIHDIIGVNSRLDAIQAAVLNVKLKYLDEYAEARRSAANRYDNLLSNNTELEAPFRSNNSSHVFHQYVIKVKNGKRKQYLESLKKHNIPHNIYYPIPLYRQKAFGFEDETIFLPATETLCKSVFAIPMHTELTEEQQGYIIDKLLS